MLRLLRGSSLLLIVVTATAFSAEEWTRFRGPGGSGASDVTGLPVEWSSEENVVWNAELSGPGTSSPVVAAERVFVTCYTGYGAEEGEPGEQSDLMRHVVAVDRRGGEILWKRDFEPNLEGRGESQYQGNGARHGFSSSTIATDGEHLYVFFGRSGVYCLDLDGNQVWNASVGDGVNGWGSSNSPVLYKDLVIINASVESRSLIALDRKAGREVWRADDIRSSWTTPILVEVPGGGTELVVSAKDWILGYKPETGEELWRAEGIHDYVCPSPVAHEGIVYAIGGRTNTGTAVKAGGRGDVTESHVLWRTNKGSNVSSPVYHDGHLYWVHERQGTAICLDAATGELVYQERLAPRPGTVYSSLTLADGKLYCQSQNNGTYVIAAKPEYELLAHNDLGDDSRANACPVPSNGQLLLRTDAALYCVGTK
ncbi:MAG: PQQ-binding-like beta-propeller repeat protein [Planctomycetes bacterium]|nr:PQQ-binding-like beta-propeller repeat protein [Planctomycetota bacterium]